MANPDWMAAIPNNSLRLNQITMPSAHDAGVSTNTYVQKGLCRKIWAVCQSQDIAGQLNSGARFFDIRFDLKGGVATTVHETAGQGGWGETAQSIFTSVKNFLDAHDQEIVILRVSHTNEKAGAAVWRAQNQYLTMNRSFHGAEGNKNLALGPLRAFRGKAIVCYAKDAFKNPDVLKGQIRFGKASDESRKGLVTCGVYPSTDNMDKCTIGALKGVLAHKKRPTQGGCVKDHLSMVYYQLTYTPGDIQAGTLQGANGVALPVGNPPPYGPTNGTHYNLPFLLAWLQGRVRGSFKDKKTNEVYMYPDGVDNNRIDWVPNIINLDFINDQVCDAIIAFNEANLRAAGKWVNVAV